MDKKEKKLFIKTTDPDTKRQLEELGFQLISSDSSGWTFLNDSKIIFDNKEVKVIHTNTLNL
jgi:hypothetical protein